MPKEIYGIRVVPKKDEEGIIFGGFVGIVINCVYNQYNAIDLLKMIQNEDGYFVESSVELDFAKVRENSQTSGEDKAKYLYSQALQLSDRNDKIAICETLVPHLKNLDSLWESKN